MNRIMSAAPVVDPPLSPCKGSRVKVRLRGPCPRTARFAVSSARSSLSRLLFGIVVVLVGASATAADITWNGSQGTDWNTASNWDGGVLPGAGSTLDNARLDVANGTTTISGTLSDSQIQALYVGENNTNVTLTHDSGNLNLIGGNAWIEIAVNPGSSGTYNLGGGGPQLGGTLNLTNDVFGVGEHGVGNFNLSDNARATAISMTVGRWNDGQGTVTQSGTSIITLNGTHTDYNGAKYSLDVGGGGGGSYTLSGGILNVNGGDLLVGDTFGSNGQFTQTGGTVNATGGWVYLGHAGTGLYTLSGGTLQIGTSSKTQRLIVGSQGVGGFDQQGGAVNVNGDISIGDLNIGRRSLYGISAGTLNSSGGILLGWGTFGGLLQSGGLVNANTQIQFGGNGGQGVYSLAGGTLITSDVHVNFLNGSTTAAGAASAQFSFTGGTLRLGNYNMQGYTGLLGPLVQLSSDAPSLLDVSTQNTTVGGNFVITAENTNGASVLVGNGHRLQVNGNLNPNAGSVQISQTSGTIATTSWLDVANGTATSVYNLSGGAANPGTDFNVADAGGTGTLNLSGNGTINVTAAGQFFIGKYPGSVGVVNQSGGTVTIAPGSALALTLGSATTGRGTYNLDGGTLTTPTILSGMGTSIFNFNGGNLRLNGGGATYMQGLTSVNVRAGGARIDTNGLSATIGQSLLHDPGLGPTSDGGLAIRGAGNLTLSGLNTYTGPTMVDAGILKLLTAGNNNVANSTVIDVASGATLDVTGVTGAGGFALNGGIGQTLKGNGTITGKLAVGSGSHLAPGESVGMLTMSGLNLQSGSVLDFEFNSTPLNDFVNVTAANGLTINGGGFNLLQEGTTIPFDTPGTYHLMRYVGALQGNGTAALSVLNPQAGMNYVFSNNTSISDVDLTITAVPEPSSLILLAIGGLAMGSLTVKRRTRKRVAPIGQAV
jgi:autotransporter-associated beta strand protein